MSGKISKAFLAFNQEAPKHAKAWSEMVGKIAQANVLDAKTTALIYISILAVLNAESGIPFHVKMAKEAGSTKEEIIHAVLIGLPPAGHRVTQVLPTIIQSYDEE